MSRFNSLSQLTRSSREGYNPSTDSGDGKPRFAPGAKISVQSFSAAGNAPDRVSDISSSKTMSNNLTSLKDSRVGGIFAKGSVKDNWRADGGLAFKPREAGALGIAGEKESSDFLTQGDAIRKKAGQAPGLTEPYADQAGDYFMTRQVKRGSAEDQSGFAVRAKAPVFAASSMDPLKPFGGKKMMGVSDNSLMDVDLGVGAQTGMTEMLDDLVFSGSMSPDEMKLITGTMGRKYGFGGTV